MLVKGLNDSQENLLEIAEILDLIKPDQIHVNVPTRPPAESWVHPPSQEVLALARNIFGEIAFIIPPPTGVFNLKGEDDLLESIIGIITRHPMREQELHQAMKCLPPEKVTKALEALARVGAHR
jgi:wyosine [tRNA(Phe)-imidazoG37] synthetase (radical SAM superfamily)